MATNNTHITKLRVGAAACALAAATTLTPAAVAHAKPDPVPVSPLTDEFWQPSLGPVELSQETPWWWVGNSPNPNASSNALAPLAQTGETIFEFTPLALVPGFLKPVAGWFLNLIPQFSVCFAGLGVKVGPYGSVKVTRGSC